MNTQIPLFSMTGSNIRIDERLPYLSLWQEGSLSFQRYTTGGGSIDDLTSSLQSYRDSIGLTPDDSPSRPGILDDLGLALGTLFKRSGDLRDLDEAITTLTLAVALTLNDTDKPARLSNLADSLRVQFERLGGIEKLEEAIRLWTRALELTPDGHLDKGALYNNLGISLHTLFKNTGRVDDLEKAITLQEQAVLLTQEGHSDKAARLNNLGLSLQERFRYSGSLEDLERAILLTSEAAEITLDSHPSKPAMLNNMGHSLHQRFERIGNPQDLEKAIQMKAQAVHLTADGHPNKSYLLGNLATSLQERFQLLGTLEDLEQAIMLKRSAVELTPDDHPEKASRLNNLGNALQQRLERLGNIDDLEMAITLKTRAVELTSDGHVQKPSRLSNLSISLHERFDRKGDPADLENAIQTSTRALDLTPEGHSERSARLDSLGNLLQTRFNVSGQPEDLDNAITLQINAAGLAPERSPDQLTRLHNLGRSLLQRFERFGDAKDLEDALVCNTRSVGLLPEGHPLRTMMLGHRGFLLSVRMRSSHAHVDDTTLALEAYLEATQHPSSPPLERLRTAVSCVTLLSLFANRFSTPPGITLLQAHERVVELIPQIVWLGNDVRGRYAEVMKLGTFINEATAYAISQGEYSRALEWLESSRAIVWSQVLQLHTPLDDLRLAYPQLADDLQHVSQVLGGVADPTPNSTPTLLSAETQDVEPSSLDAQARSLHSYALEYQKLIEQVRGCEGFQSFLRPKSLSQLAKASSGPFQPVVIINVHESRCDALVLLGSADIIHVPLTQFSYNDAKRLQSQLWSILRQWNLLGRFRNSGTESEIEGRGGRTVAKDGHHPVMLTILSELWKCVVKPVIDALSDRLHPHLTTRSLPHITWCPTGPLVFLPLHAAGIYSSKGPRECIMDIAVSSYTPTLDAMLKSRAHIPSLSGDYPGILVVSQPFTPGYSPIKETRTEAKIVASYLGQSMDVLDDVDGTVNAVLAGMVSHSWIHLACHGMQNPEDPTKSSFALYDGKLSLATLISKHLPDADLAVLSACQTATGNENVPEEAVHLAAGMLTVGYKSVVGTMWSIYDNSAPIVMERFYEVIAQQIKEGNASEELQPGYALHEATQVLRQQYGTLDFVRWVPFVHFGL